MEKERGKTTSCACLQKVLRNRLKEGFKFCGLGGAFGYSDIGPEATKSFHLGSQREKKRSFFSAVNKGISTGFNRRPKDVLYRISFLGDLYRENRFKVQRGKKKNNFKKKRRAHFCWVGRKRWQTPVDEPLGKIHSSLVTIFQTGAGRRIGRRRETPASASLRYTRLQLGKVENSWGMGYME